MAFKRSSVRSRSAPPIKSRVYAYGRDLFSCQRDKIGRSKIPSIPWQVVLACARFFEFISKLTGFPAPFTATGVRGVMMHATYDCSKAKRELGFSPKVTLTEGMHKVADWLSGKNA